MYRRDFLILTPALAMSGCVSVGGAAGPPVPAPSVGPIQEEKACRSN